MPVQAAMPAADGPVLQLQSPPVDRFSNRQPEPETPCPKPVRTLAFYRKHTEKVLVRYLYASMQVARAPEMLREPLSQGWASTRIVKTFEDALIFVLDVETCVAMLNPLDQMLLTRIVLQDYTFSEAALLLRLTDRYVRDRFGRAVDALTELLLDHDLLDLPNL